MANILNTFRDFTYLYVLTVIAWAVLLSGWTITQGRNVNVDIFIEQWFMLIIIALVMIIPTFAYRWSKENLP